MAKLYFYYASMNAGKSTALLQAAHNYKEQGHHVLLIKPEVDDRSGSSNISSRIGLESLAIPFDAEANLYELTLRELRNTKLSCVLVDESQFMTDEQVQQLCDVVDFNDIPVVCYGLRTDFQGNFFPGSGALLARADKLIELKGICHCGKKANFVLRRDKAGRVVKEGDQVMIGGNDRYEAVCRHHHRRAMLS